MCASEAQIAANRRNAQLSTGPRTPSGKEQSRANALKHGLCASIVVTEDLALIQQRAYEWYYTLKPQNEYHSWLVDKITIYSLRIDRSERIERRHRDRKALHAEVAWADDRRLAVAKLGKRIGKDPEAIVEELRLTPQGCQWLIDRWALLADSAEAGGSWTSDQSRLAFDLLGMPLEFRKGRKPGIQFDGNGRLVEGSDNPLDVARREIAALVERRDHLEGLDEVDRSLTVADLHDEDDPALRRHRRYEAALHNRLRWCLAQLRYESPHFKPHPDLKPRWVAEIPPEPKPETGSPPVPEPAPAPGAAQAKKTVKRPRERILPNPPFDLEPDECPAPGVAVDLPAIMASRREKKAKKAEQRRDSRRRKLERLRA